MHPRVRTLLCCLCLLWLVGCASVPPGPRSPRDPWEKMNRTTYKFNDALDRGFIKPVAKGYQRFLPQWSRTGINNFITNLEYPVVMANDLLQGQFKGFFNDTGRLLMNTTLGFLGFFDPATTAGLDKNNRDLGQTFGKWGFKTGPYLVLPVLGPSDVRDGLGRLGDLWLNPRHYLNSNWASWGLWALEGIDLRANLLYLDPTIQNAYDPYAFIRNAYLQNRDFMVNGGQSTEEEDQEQKLLEQVEQEDKSSGSAAPAAPPEGAKPPEAQPQEPAPKSESPPPPQ
jgi:phospholipid-binding lipoprotein MlaA